MVERGRVVYRWDLDKTYLRTEFDTVRDLLRTAFESASQKRTVPGAAALLREIRSTDPLGIYIVSGSPEQLRRVLEAKLRLDGVRWDGFVLKPQLSNILKGKFRFIKDQVGYKLSVLLESRQDMPPEIDELMFGDDAEADAFIYSIYSDLCAGRVKMDVLEQVLVNAGVYEDDLPRILDLAEHAPRHDGGRRIFIHLDRVSSPDAFGAFGRRVVPFYNYLQPALVLLELGAVTASGVLRVAAELVLGHGFTGDALAASYTDLAERGHLGGAAATALSEAFEHIEEAHFARTYPVLATFLTQLEHAAQEMPAEAAPVEDEIDYVELFTRDKLRARLAKERLSRRH